MSYAKSLRDLYRKAMSFHSHALWTRFENEDIFAVKVPEDPDPLVVSIMGGAGEEFGLFIQRGPRALERMRTVIEGGYPGGDAAEDWDIISFSFERFRDVPPELRRWLRRANVRVKSGATVPFVVVKKPGKRARELDATEVGIMRRLIDGIIHAAHSDLLTPKKVKQAEEVLTLDISGPLDRLEVSLAGETRLTLTAEPPPQLHIDRAAILKLPRLKRAWIVGCPVTPVSIANSDDVVRTLIIVEKGSGSVVDAQAMGGPMWRYSAVSRVFEVMEGHGLLQLRGRPKQVLVASKGLVGQLCPELRALRVPCRYEPSAEGPIRAALESFMAFLDETRGGGPEEGELEEELVHWKEVDRRVMEMGRAKVIDLVEGDTRLRTRFYGGAKERALVENSELDEVAGQSFIDWAWIDYRPVKSKRTIAEELLDGASLDGDDRALLESLVASTTSLYRVADLTPGRSVTLEDVLRGGRVAVTDIALSRSVDAGLGFPARVYAAGPYQFITCVGAVLLPHMGAHALGFLEAQGLATTPAALRKSAHLFGRLWAWALQVPAMPTLVTTEGDPVELHKATFRVAEPDELRRVLEARDDIAPVGERGRYDWLGGRSNVGDGPVVQARLTLRGDILEVETSSASRWERFRGWLEGIEGVELLDLERIMPEELADSPGGGPKPPSVFEDLSEQERAAFMAEVEKMFESMAERWVNEQIPALDGLTPREAVRTKAGRRKVQQLLRTFTPPTTNLEGVTGPSPNLARRLLGLPEEDDGTP